MLKRLSNLIGIRKIVTLFIVGTFVFLSIKGVIKEDRFMDVVLMVISFYFARSTALDSPKKEEV